MTTKNSAAPAAPPAAAAETAEPTDSAALPAALSVGLPPTTEEAVDLARAVTRAMQRSELRAARLSATVGRLRATLLRVAQLLADGNSAGAGAEVRDALGEDSPEWDRLAGTACDSACGWCGRCS